MSVSGFCRCVVHRLAPVVIISAVGGCVFRPAEDPGLARVIKAHYAAHATEEAGVCRTPAMDSIRSREPVGQATGNTEVLAVRYSYFDRNADMDADWDALFHTTQPCGGLAERRFTMERTALGYRVVDMSGEQRGGESVD